MIRRLAIAGVAVSTVIAACGGGTDTSTTSAAPATTAAQADTTAPQTTALADTVPSPESTAAPESTTVAAAFDGPAFVDTIDAALAPYQTAIGQPGTAETLAAALPGVTADVPVPGGLTIAGVGRIAELWAGEVDDEQLASFAEALTAADLEAFGASSPNGWAQASVATSGSLTTLLLTPAGDARRTSYVADSEAASAGSAPLEMRFVPAETTMPEPTWLASLPHLDGGELTEVVEGVGSVTMFFGPAGNGYVSARWRYPADALDALNAFLESGVVEAAGFTYDKDLFNGFQNMVDITVGDWTGSVLIGEATIDDDVFYDLVWTLSRA